MDNQMNQIINEILKGIGRDSIGEVILDKGLNKFTGNAVAKIYRSNGKEDYVGVCYSEFDKTILVMFDPSTKMGYCRSIICVYAYDDLGLINEHTDVKGDYRTVNI